MSMLRMRSLFDPDPLKPGSMPPPEQQVNTSIGNSIGHDEGSPAPPQAEAKSPRISMSTDFEGIKQIANMIRDVAGPPDESMQNQLQQHIGNYPIQQKPSLYNKLTAMFAGGAAGDPNVARNYLDRDYNKQVGDWKNKVQPMENLALTEDRSNTDRTNTARIATNAYLGDRRADDLATQNDIKNKQADERIRQTDARNAIARLSALGGTVQFRSDGQPIIVHRDGSISEIPTEMMTAGQLAKLKARTGSPLRPNEIAREKFDRIQQLLAIHPEWEQWLELGQNNTYRLAAVDEGWDFGSLGKVGGNGLDTATRSKILAEIEGGNVAGKPAAQASHGITAAPKGTATKPSALPTPLPGHILMYNSNGELGNVPEDQVERALKADYKKAGGTESPF